MASREEKFEKLFNRLDTDHSGDLDIDEFRKWLGESRHKFSERDIKDIFNWMDKRHSKDGKISKFEFVSSMMEIYNKSKK